MLFALVVMAGVLLLTMVVNNRRRPRGGIARVPHMADRRSTAAGEAAASQVQIVVRSTVAGATAEAEEGISGSASGEYIADRPRAPWPLHNHRMPTRSTGVPHITFEKLAEMLRALPSEAKAAVRVRSPDGKPRLVKTSEMLDLVMDQTRELVPIVEDEGAYYGILLEVGACAQGGNPATLFVFVDQSSALFAPLRMLHDSQRHP